MSQKTENPKEAASISLEEGIAEWRSYIRRRQAIHRVDADELEDHLRSQASTLVEAGLTEDEAFLIAVKRIGDSMSSRANSPGNTRSGCGNVLSSSPTTAGMRQAAPEP